MPTPRPPKWEGRGGHGLEDTFPRTGGRANRPGVGTLLTGRHLGRVSKVLTTLLRLVRDVALTRVQ